jgi:SpoVK/Ycf46/Vps4 family AAA+-type ATPase
MAEDTEVSVPPLKAHETRNIEWAKTATTEQEKADFLAKAAGFRKRIEAIQGATPSAADAASETAQLKPEPTFENLRAPTEPEPTLSEPTNLILYGPPGTGKTFTTAVEAVR